MVKNPPAKAQVANTDPVSGRYPREENGKPTPVFLPGKSHGQKSLAGYGAWGRKELDMK